MGAHGHALTRVIRDFIRTLRNGEQALANSERYAGWSRSRVQQLNNSNDGYTYTINTRQQAYIISKGNKQTKKAYAYEIHVTQSWNRTEVVYEDVFDSYSMDLNTFKAQLNARLSEFNDNEEGYVYYIASDARNYYQATDAAKIAGMRKRDHQCNLFRRGDAGARLDTIQVSQVSAAHWMPTPKSVSCRPR